VTDEQRSRRPIFKATLRAAASWLFFRVARLTVMIQISALRSRLEKQPTDLRPYASYIRDDALGGFRFTYLGEQVGLQANNMAIGAASTNLVDQFAQQLATPSYAFRGLMGHCQWLPLPADNLEDRGFDPAGETVAARIAEIIIEIPVTNPKPAHVACWTDPVIGLRGAQITVGVTI